MIVGSGSVTWVRQPWWSVMTLGEGKSKKQVPVADERARMPITDCTADDQGVGFVIGVGGNTPERDTDAKAAASPTSQRSPRRGGTKSK